MSDWEYGNRRFGLPPFVLLVRSDGCFVVGEGRGQRPALFETDSEAELVRFLCEHTEAELTERAAERDRQTTILDLEIDLGDI